MTSNGAADPTLSHPVWIHSINNTECCVHPIKTNLESNEQKRKIIHDKREEKKIKKKTKLKLKKNKCRRNMCIYAYP